MSRELSDSQLDILWMRYLEGEEAPSGTIIHLSDQGPQIIIQEGISQYVWTLEHVPSAPRRWKKVLILG